MVSRATTKNYPCTCHSCQCIVRSIIFPVAVVDILSAMPTRMMAARFNRRSRANKMELDGKIWFLEVRVETRVREQRAKVPRYRIVRYFAAKYSWYKAHAAISLTVFRWFVMQNMDIAFYAELSTFVCAQFT